MNNNNNTKAWSLLAMAMFADEILRKWLSAELKNEWKAGVWSKD